MTPTPDPAHGALNEGQLSALLTLLGDEDPAVWRPVRSRLAGSGAAVLNWLEKHRLHPEPAIRRRVRSIFQERDSAAADGAFMAFLLTHGDSFDLEEATWLFVRTRYSEINVAGYEALLDEYAGEIAADVAAAEPGEAQLKCLNVHLFQHLGFKGNDASYYDPDNSYLNRVMDRKLGIPISLSVLYVFVARRLHLPVVGIGMPGHFICRYQSPRETIYIDPFHGGTLLSAADCLQRIQKLDVPYEEAHLTPVSPRKLLIRMIQNVQLIHRERKDREQANRLHRYLVALGR